jgi:hypothetical protein
LGIAASRKRAGESDIVDRIEIRDEIETLENAANVICSKLVSLLGGHLIQALVQNGDVSTGACQQSAHYVKQGGFAGSRRAMDQNAFATLDAPPPNIQ